MAVLLILQQLADETPGFLLLSAITPSSCGIGNRLQPTRPAPREDAERHRQREREEAQRLQDAYDEYWKQEVEHYIVEELTAEGATRVAGTVREFFTLAY